MKFSGIKPNLAKSKIAGTAVLKGVQVLLCGMRYVDLNDDTLKIVSTNHSYDKKLKVEKKSKTVTDIQLELKASKMRLLLKLFWVG